MTFVKQLWASVVQRLLPPSSGEEAAVRSLFFVRGWLVAIAIAVISSLMYAAMGNWSQVVITLPLIFSGPVLLKLLRRGVHFNPLVHTTFVIACLTFAMGTLAQRPADFTSLSQLLLIPLLAGFLLGSKQAKVWLIVTMAVATPVIIAADSGWLYPAIDPMPALSHVINFSVGLTLSYLFASTFDDVQLQAISRLQDLGRARSAFLANISHEIRTPMNGVLGMTEVLLQDTLSTEHREQLSVIQRSGNTLVSLINDLLDVSKMEAGKLELEETDFNLSTVLTDVQSLIVSIARGKGLELVVRKGEGVPERLRGDGLRLGQVLTNLVSNAVKFTAAGEVRLEVDRVPSESGLQCRFAVSDTGMGIPPEVLPLLFNAFQQGDTSTTRRFGGTGLGLALSQQLITLMGGHITVTSQSNVGSCFSFTVAFREGQQQAVAPPEAPRVTGPKKWVLVVDDNAVNLAVAVKLVEKAGYHARGVKNGREAVEAVSQGTYSLVLMDCHMPEMDGFEATERIRGLSAEVKQTPIVAITASAMPDEVAACRRSGMNSVLAKPLTYSALRETLALHLR